jgi:succinate-acetate transporter protein
LPRSARRARRSSSFFWRYGSRFLLLAGGEWTGSVALRMAGGYGGLLTAVLEFYLSAADVINEVYERTVFPIGQARTFSRHAVILQRTMTDDATN